MIKKYFSSKKGFTLIEVAAVVGVLAVTTAVLLVNNRLNEQQLALSQDAANLANAISRAKALTLQNLDDSICGYGVHFIPKTDIARDSFVMFKDIKIGGVCDYVYSGPDEILPGEGNEAELGSGLRFVSSSNSAAPVLIKDVLFYSSDARVRLTGFNNQEISPAGVIIVGTESIPASFMTLKITTTGQVTSKNGAYENAQNFDTGTQSEIEVSASGQFAVGGIKEGNFIVPSGNETEPGSGNEMVFGNEDCIPDCSCAIGLGSGQTCSDGCGGTCYAGAILGCVPNPAACAGKTCADSDNCGAPCIACSSGEYCIDKQCTVCTPSCVGKVCGDDNGCGGICTTCPSGQVCTTQAPYSCQTPGVDLRINSVNPPVGYK